jgi:hypothetical protein
VALNEALARPQAVRGLRHLGVSVEPPFLREAARAVGAALAPTCRLLEASMCGTQLAGLRPDGLIKEIAMARYGKKASEKVHKALQEEQHGQLKSGSGRKVTSRKQAVAIGLSQARKAGAKVPKRSSSRSH